MTSKNKAIRFDQHEHFAVASLPLAIALALYGVNVQAQTTVDSGSTRVVTNANGVQLIDIAGANGAGVSHNRFIDYNVGRAGQVLNNNAGSQSVDSGLAGRINPNSNLNGAAAVILNEVTGHNPSHLNGQIEVAGSRADLILANPYGISVNGASFSNIGRATLSTGAPQTGNDGSVSGFEVRGGDITVDGAGLNAGSAEVLDLLARRVALDGQIRGDRVNITAGANRIDYASGETSAIRGEDDFDSSSAIDATALGGIQANRIHLLSTERGVGVNMDGELAANAGEFTLTASGDIILTSRIVASGDIDINTRQTGNISLEKADINSGSNLLIASADNLTLLASTLEASGNGSLSAASELRVDALAKTRQDQRDKAWTDADGYQVEETQIESTTIQQASKVATGGDLQLVSGGTTTIAASDVVAAGRLDAEAGRNFNLIARADTSTHDTTRVRQGEGLGGGAYGIITSQTQESTSLNRAASLEGGEGAQVKAGRNLLVQGSDSNADLQANGNLQVLAGHNLYSREELSTQVVRDSSSGEGVVEASHTPGGSDNTFKWDFATRVSGIGEYNFLDVTTESRSEQSDTLVASNLVSATGLTLTSGGTLKLQGVHLAAADNLQLSGVQVEIGAGQNLSRSSSETVHTRLGLRGTGETQLNGTLVLNGDWESNIDFANFDPVRDLSRLGELVVGGQADSSLSLDTGVEGEGFFGLTRNRNSSHSESLTQQFSQLTTDGDLGVTARLGVNLSGATLEAGNNLSIKGASITSKAVHNVTRSSTEQAFDETGFYLSGKASGQGSGTFSLGGSFKLAELTPVFNSVAGAEADVTADADASLSHQSSLEQISSRTSQAQGNQLSAGKDLLRSAAFAIQDEATQAQAGGNITQQAASILDTYASDVTESTYIKLTQTTQLAWGGKVSASGAQTSNGLPIPTAVAADEQAKASHDGTLDYRTEQQRNAVTSHYQAEGDISSNGVFGIGLYGTTLAAGGKIDLSGSVLDYGVASNVTSQAEGNFKIGVIAAPNLLAPSVGLTLQGQGEQSLQRHDVAGRIDANDIRLRAGVISTLGTSINSNTNLRLEAPILALRAAGSSDSHVSYSLDGALAWQRALEGGSHNAGFSPLTLVLPVGGGSLPVRFALDSQVGANTTLTFDQPTQLTAGGNYHQNALLVLDQGAQVNAGSRSGQGWVIALDSKDVKLDLALDIGVDNNLFHISLPRY